MEAINMSLLGDAFKSSNSNKDENLTSLLYLDNQTTQHTGDQGEQQLYSFTIPANFFTQNGSKLQATIRLKIKTLEDYLSASLIIKLDGTPIYNNAYFFSENLEHFFGETDINLIEMLELAGAISVANVGPLNPGHQTYNNSLSHTISFHFVDNESKPTNTFRGSYCKVIHTK